MLPLQLLAYQVEQIPDLETRHRARSLLACYLGYGELRQESPVFAQRAVALKGALQDLGITALPAEDEVVLPDTARAALQHRLLGRPR